MCAEARKKDIPIVQLNPGGTLNHKYAGETAVRSSGLPYSVIRSTGLLLLFAVWTAQSLWCALVLYQDQDLNLGRVRKVTSSQVLDLVT